MTLYLTNLEQPRSVPENSVNSERTQDCGYSVFTLSLFTNKRSCFYFFDLVMFFGEEMNLKKYKSTTKEKIKEERNNETYSTSSFTNRINLSLGVVVRTSHNRNGHLHI